MAKNRYIGSKLAAMTTTIDKFGRILIPRSVRKELGLEAGTTLDISILGIQKKIQLEPIVEKNYKFDYTDWGWPIIVRDNPTAEKSTFSIVDMINEGREERADIIAGNHE